MSKSYKAEKIEGIEPEIEAKIAAINEQVKTARKQQRAIRRKRLAKELKASNES